MTAADDAIQRLFYSGTRADLKPGRVISGAARFVQQPQFRQVQGLQRQPPFVQLQAQAGLAFSVFNMVFLLSFALWRIAL